MIEAVLIDYLTNKTAAGAYVYAEVPADQPESYIVIEKTGSTTENWITTSTIAVRSIASSLLAAAALNEQVKAAMLASPELDAIAACRLNSDYNFTDATSKQYRYQAVFQVTHY
jgi:ABC-type xylose transport system permease subunit